MANTSTKLEPRGVNTQATFQFANLQIAGNLTQGNIQVSGVANLGDVSNVKIFGGSTNYVLKTDGAGNLSWTAQTGGGGGATSPGGSDTQIQFNDAGSFNGNANLTFNKSTKTLTVDKIIANGSQLSSLPAANLTGSLSGLVVSNATGIVNFTTTANVTLGAVANLHISGGTSGQVLSTDGSGSLSWATVSGGGGSYSNTNTAAYLPTYTGNVSANYFIGNGSTLTYITGSNVNGNVTGAVQSHYANIANSVAGSNVSGAVSSATTAGTVTTAAQPNITSVGTLTGLTSGGVVDFGTSSNVTLGVVGNVRITGGTNGYVLSTNGSGGLSWVAQSGGGGSYSNTNTAAYLPTYTGNVSANYFIGNGSTLTYIAGANVSGAVSYATTANAVAGSNVSGTVAQATYAGTANSVAGSNVSGAVSYATTANAVAGSNVSGTVAQATYAGTANSVSWSNVSTTPTTLSGYGITDAYSNTNTAAYLPTHAGNINGNNLILTGNLTISGTTTTVNSTTTRIVDPITELGGGANGAALATDDNKDRGLLLHYYTTAPVDAFIGWDDSNGEFGVGSNVSVTSEVVTWNNYGNIRAGNFIGNGSALTGIVASSATTAGTVTTAAQPNITSVGTLTSLGVTGTTTSGNFATAGNITASFLVSNVATGTAPLQVTSTTVVPNLYVARANVSDYSSVTTATTGNYYINLINAVTGNVQEYANSVFVANVSNGAITATTFVGALSGAATSATIAGTVTTAAQPNITSVGTLTSLGVTGTTTSGNFATAGNITASFLVSNVATGTAPFTVTSTTRVANLNVAYANVSDSINVTAPGTGTGYLIFANATTGNVLEWTSAGISSNLANNSITATTFVGALTGAATSATTAGTVTTAAQSNITSVGTLTSLGVTGTTTSGNFATAGNITASFLVSNVATGTAPLTVTSTTRVANLNVAYANVADFNVITTQTTGTFYPVFVNGSTTANYALASNSNISVSLATGNLSATILYATGNITGGNLIGRYANGNSNINIPAANGNVNISAVGNANILIVTGTGINVTGTFNTGTGNANIGNIGTAQLLASANITAPQLISNVATGTAPLTVTSTTRVTNLNVAYSNVTDYVGTGVASSGNFNITLQSGTTGNIQPLGNTAFIANATSGTLYTGNLVVGTNTTSANANIGNITSNISLLNWTTIQQTTEVMLSPAFAATIACDLSTGAIFYVTSATQNFTLNFTNAPTTVGRTIVATVFIIQGVTGYYGSAVQIGGVAQTIKWSYNTTPTPLASKTEVQTITLIRTSAGAWVVLGDYGTYG